MLFRNYIKLLSTMHYGSNKHNPAIIEQKNDPVFQQDRYTVWLKVNYTAIHPLRPGI